MSSKNRPERSFTSSGDVRTSWLVMYYLFKIIPAVVACFSIYLGYKLFILGVTGQASLSVESKDVKGQLLNAAPGLFFAVGGIVALIIVVWKSVNVEIGDEGGDGKLRKFMSKRSMSRR
ncbi:MAG: hypothetical protein ABR603_02710 [Pyrinomonadaceae bacterium]